MNVDVCNYSFHFFFALVFGLTLSNRTILFDPHIFLVNMLLSSVYGLFVFAGIAASIPTPASLQSTPVPPDLVNPKSPAPEPITFEELKKRALHHEEIVVYGQGRAEIWQRSVYMAANAELLSHPGHDLPSISVEDIIAKSQNASLKSRSMEKRKGCSKLNIVYMNPTKTFLDWDQPISPIAHNAYASARVLIDKNHDLEQGVKVELKGGEVLIKDVFSMAQKIAYNYVWTTSDDSGLTYFVPAGFYGVVSSNARATRFSGKVKWGCVGEPEMEWGFQTDKYSDMYYGGMKWVEGSVGLCMSKNYPIPGCIGGQPIT